MYSMLERQSGRGGGGVVFLWKYIRRYTDPVDFFHMNKLVGEMVIMNDLE